MSRANPNHSLRPYDQCERIARLAREEVQRISRKREAVILAKRLVRVLPRVPFALPSCTRAMLEADVQVTL